jgi:predicted enzyme related to lactoylglutathione lyase
MTDSSVATAAKPNWVDISAKDTKAAQQYYGELFGWEVEDLGPDAGGYAFFRKDGKVAAGVGPLQMDEQPTVWSVYIGTDDAAAVAEKVTAAGGTVVAPPMDVMGQGRMAVFQDSVGAFISVWQPESMKGLETSGESGTFGWAEITARGIDKARDFYASVFGWGVKESPMEENQKGRTYTEWQLDGQSIGGGLETPETMPPQVPSFWMPYFMAADIDAVHAKAVELGGQSLMEPQEFPGGRFAVLSDSQGAWFGLLSMPQH